VNGFGFLVDLKGPLGQLPGLGQLPLVQKSGDRCVPAGIAQICQSQDMSLGRAFLDLDYQPTSSTLAIPVSR
jgi:hypothetical protein